QLPHKASASNAHAYRLYLVKEPTPQTKPSLRLRRQSVISEDRDYCKIFISLSNTRLFRLLCFT
ncbi:MAG: hypothetical protein N2040_05840, partial [Caldimonas manganoxidans]|nr:hypothetical protein [Caldimonas manganoxidans]